MASDVRAYLDSLPPERRKAIEAVRKVIRKNLPPGFVEGIHFGMIGYCVPLSRFPDTYNGQPLGVAALASQKQYMALYLNCVYGDPALRRWFEEAYRRSGKKLDMGKSCVRFKSLDDLPLDVVGATIARVSVDDLIAAHEAARPSRARSMLRAPAPAQGGSRSAGALHPPRGTRPRARTRRPSR